MIRHDGLVKVVTIVGAVLSTYGCASFSTCDYGATGIIAFPTSGQLPLTPPLPDAIKVALAPLGFSNGAPRALPNTNPLVVYSIGGWPKMSGERVDVSLDTTTARIGIFDFNHSTGLPASKFDRKIMDVLADSVRDNYGGSIEFKPSDARFCLGP